MRQLFSRFHLGGRVLKTVLAVTLAIFLAQQLGLERVGLAAIVAVVTVQRTFYYSLVKSLGKLGSVVLGVLLGSTFGHFFGITPLAYGIVTFLAIMICLQLHWQDNIILTTVTAITVIFSGAPSLPVYSLEQILTALLGAASALSMNYLFTPNHRKDVTGRLINSEEGLRKVVDFIIKEMLEPGCDDTAFREQVSSLREEIRIGMDTAMLLREEQRFIVTRQTPSDHYRQAFHIFNSQLDRLEEMHKLARRMVIEVPEAIPLVKLFRLVQKIQYNRIRGKRTAYAKIEQVIEKLDERTTAMDLPHTRAEFISRASLFHLAQEIKRYYRRTQKLPAVASEDRGNPQSL